MIPAAGDGSLVGSWCHDGCRDYLTDYSTGGNDMTAFGTARSEEYNSFWGDGNSDYLRSAVANFRISDEVGTIEAWVNITSIGAQRTIFGSCDEGSDTNKLLFWIRFDGSLAVQSESGGGGHNNIRGTTTILTTNAWYYCVVTSDGSAYALYVNGIPQTLATSGGTNNGHWFADAADRDSVTIGCRSKDSATDYYWPGEIAAVNVYSEAKSADWVATRYERAIPDDDLVLSVPYGDRDYSKYGDDLAPIADPILGRWMTFDGTHDYLRRDEANWRSSDSAGTIIAWVRPANITGQKTIFCSADTATANHMLALVLNAGAVNLHTYISGAYTQVEGAIDLVANAWSHVAIASSGTGYFLYVNGVLDSLTGTDNGNWLADVLNRDNIAIGMRDANTDTWPFNGDISDVRVYSAAKSADWVLMDYLSTRGAY